MVTPRRRHGSRHTCPGADQTGAPLRFAAQNALVLERGVLSITPDGRYDMAIPSMARWLAGER